MKRYLRTSIIICILLCLPALAEQVRQLSRGYLVPAKLLADDPLTNLTADQQDLVQWVVKTLQTLPKRGPDTEEFYKEVDEAIPELKKSGIDMWISYQKYTTARGFRFVKRTLKFLSYHNCRQVYAVHKSKFSQSSYSDYRPTGYAEIPIIVYFFQISIFGVRLFLTVKIQR